MSVQVSVVEKADSTTAEMEARVEVIIGDGFDVGNFVEKFGVFVDTEGGIRGLRGWVLDLAISGRLSGNDDSSSRKGGGMQALTWIPASWSISTLGDSTDIVRGITFPASVKRKQPTAGHVACLRTSNVQRNIEWEDLLYVPEAFVRSSDQWVREGDLCISMANSHDLVGKVAPIVGSRPTTTFGGFLGIIRPKGNLLAAYLTVFMRSPTVQRELRKGATQTTNIANISLGRLRPLPVSVPPLAEQKRIVARVDQLMALIDDLEARQTKKREISARFTKASLEALTTAEGPEEFDAAWKRVVENFPTVVDRAEKVAELRRTVLELAVQGVLERRDATDEPAAALLRRIAALRELANTREQRLDDDPIRARPAILPETWAWCRVGEFAVVRLGGTPKREELRFWNGGVPWVSSGEVANCRISTTKETLTEAGLRESNAKLYPPGTVLIAMIGQGKTRGQSALLDIEAATNQNVAALCFDQGNIHAPYIWLWARSEYAKTRAEGRGGAQPALNGKMVRGLMVPLPPLAEQKRIVAKVDHLMKLCDDLEARLRRAEDRASTLVEAIVQETVA